MPDDAKQVTPDDFNRAGNMDELFGLLEKIGVNNGWAKKTPSLWPLPNKDFVPAHWRYSQAKAALDAAGRFVNTELAERRNLIMFNPIEGNDYATVKTLISAYQMVKAGETAKSHRHSANALRLVLDTKPHAYTIVDGKKIPMEPGDVLLTPNWSWHAHANEGTGDAYWMDVLDVPTVHLLGPMFFEHHPDGIEEATAVAADSPCRFPWAQTQARLDAAPDAGPGRREIELTPFMDTIALEVIRLDAGASFDIDPSTLSSIYAIMDGTGTTTIDGQNFDWARGDALAVPASTGHRWTARERSHILRASDKPLLEKLNWLRPVPARPA